MSTIVGIAITDAQVAGILQLTEDQAWEFINAHSDELHCYLADCIPEAVIVIGAEYGLYEREEQTGAEYEAEALAYEEAKEAEDATRQ